MPQLAPTPWRVQEAIFVADGFRFVRQVGSHRSYVKPAANRDPNLPHSTCFDHPQ
jgi:predicted RNA binding protein YcfA (HicA-like mRNA interferase family)